MTGGILSWLMSPSGLTPHGFCLLWEPGLIWTDAVADFATGAAYFTIPIALAVILRRHQTYVFRPILWLFISFILLCGITHWLDLLTLWVPVYVAQGAAKAVAAAVSVVTAIALCRVLPEALSRPTLAEFREVLENLRQRNDFLDRTGHLAGVGGWELELATGRLSWFPETFRIHGLPLDYQPTLDAAIGFYAAEAQPIIRAAVEKSIADGSSWDLELAFFREGGSPSWVRAVGSVVFQDGKPVRLIGAIQDVTARVHERLMLKRLAERVSLATECAGVGIWEWDIASDTIVWDPLMYRLYGREPRDEVSPFGLWQEHLHPEDRKAAEGALRDYVDGVAPFDTEFRIVWPDKSVHVIRAMAAKAKDAEGVVTHIIGVNLDLTEARTLAEERDRQTARLAESEANFRLMAENATDMISHVGSDGGRLYVSPAAKAIFGVPPETLIDHNIVTLLHPDDAGAFTEWQSDLLAGKAVSSRFTYRIQHPERDEVWAESGVKALPGMAPGEPGGFVSVVRDVTERVRFERERDQREAELRMLNAELDQMARNMSRAKQIAEQANRAKTRFLASMSHELRTPLNGILGYAQLLRMDGNLTEIQSERLQAMLSAGTHLLGMISCVLDLSEIETESMELHIASVNLRALMESTVTMVRPQSEAKHLSLGLNIAPDVPDLVETDAARLRQILLNLLGNAVKYTSGGGVEARLLVISRASQLEGDWLRFEVADSGPGIPTDQQHLLFGEFQRLGNTTDSLVEGAGLGLSLAKRIAILLGGSVNYSPNPAGGSVFRLDIPLVAGSNATQAAITALDFTQIEAAPVISDQPKNRVLVVDDVPMNRDIAAAFIASAGYEVVCAAGGEQAVALAAENDFLVILMDVRMPGVDGLEATRRIRATGAERGGVPIVALTAQVFTEQINTCRDAGMDTHVAKPFTLETLLGAIERGVAAAQARGGGSRAGQAAGEAGQDVVAFGAHLPVLNTATFTETVAVLNPDAARTFLDSVSRRIEALLEDISQPDAGTPDRLAALRFDVHALAGSAGMFGFERLLFVGRDYESGELAQMDALTAELKAVLCLSATALHAQAEMLLGEQVA
jgi:PAS domain S-box-containing protein